MGLGILRLFQVSRIMWCGWLALKRGRLEGTRWLERPFYYGSNDYFFREAAREQDGRHGLGAGTRRRDGTMVMILWMPRGLGVAVAISHITSKTGTSALLGSYPSSSFFTWLFIQNFIFLLSNEPRYSLITVIMARINHAVSVGECASCVWTLQFCYCSFINMLIMAWLMVWYSRFILITLSCFVDLVNVQSTRTKQDIVGLILNIHGSIFPFATVPDSGIAPALF